MLLFLAIMALYRDRYISICNFTTWICESELLESGGWGSVLRIWLSVGFVFDGFVYLFLFFLHALQNYGCINRLWLRFILSKKKKRKERQENETKTNTDNIINHNEASCQMISFSMFIKCFACTHSRHSK